MDLLYIKLMFEKSGTLKSSRHFNTEDTQVALTLTKFKFWRTCSEIRSIEWLDEFESVHVNLIPHVPRDFAAVTQSV